MLFPAPKSPIYRIRSCSTMHTLIFLLMVITVIKAQTPQRPRGDAVSNFQPSLPVVVAILALLFTLTFILLLFAKCCHRQEPLYNQQNLASLAPSRSPYSGIDKTVIESLPFFKFSALKGSRQGLECAVCLSKFQDIEILRLLPTCRHAFHIACVDQWLERHSTCPLCRHKISSEDLALITYSDSLRMLMTQSDLRQDSNLELFVQREEEDNNHHGSSRFSPGSSFKNCIRGKQLPIQDRCDKDEDSKGVFDKLNHKIIIADVVLLKNRWSSVTSSDLMSLNSEMISEASSNRLPSKQVNYEHFANAKDGHQFVKIKEELDQKKHGKNGQTDKISFTGVPNNAGRNLDPNEKRSMSEIIVHPRFLGSVPLGSEINVIEERQRKLWLPIATRTVEWFANRERGSAQSQHSQDI
ncbi:RING-H2 finger protein ATL4J [Heracleum sosnowskyi]|uniref:RING-type E3 ubiquitin transferase n=1 Tax=Heracleum sosnowskyi TaxID=360622 RepID=A0AAD8J479_9APIA|nr:RING-H2 finger protein ATL4J [Heracleum sosnowskyi]